MSLIATFTPRRNAQIATHEALRCRIRIRARVAGCRRPEILAVDAEAVELLRAGETQHDVLERCTQLARALVEQRRAVPA